MFINFFRASQFGYDQICQHLINAKADSRAHPVTKYSPLYIAVHQGHYAVTELLLNAFPFLINVSSIDSEKSESSNFYFSRNQQSKSGYRSMRPVSMDTQTF